MKASSPSKRWFAPVAFAAAHSVAGSARAGEAEVRIGSKRFTESYILAEIAAATVRHAGGAASHAQGLGGTALVFRALEEGSIDVYPEYTGTLAETVLHSAGASDVATLRSALAARGLAMTDPLGFDDTYGIAVTASLAASLHLVVISDLARAAGLRFGFSPEFMGRSDGLPGLTKRYGLADSHVQEMDHGLGYAALARGAIDVIDVYSTDAAIARYGLQVLRDDRALFPSYEAVYVYREDATRRLPRAMHAIEGLSGAIDATAMTALNARAEIAGVTFESVAESFVRARSGLALPAPVHRQGLLGGIVSTIRNEGPRHLSLVGISLLFAVVAGIPLGLLARRARVLGAVVLGMTSVVQTIPSLALLCFFIPILGTGQLPALAALFLYAILPIARNTLAGLEAIPPALRESAAALGLTPWARVARIDLPLASPLILAGIRTSAVISVGTATLAAFIGGGGFGVPISTGLNLNDDALILEGAIPAALFALGVEGLFTLLGRTLVPKGLRLAPPRSGE